MVFLKLNDELIINAEQITEISLTRRMVKLSSGTCLYLKPRDFEVVKSFVIGGINENWNYRV